MDPGAVLEIVNYAVSVPFTGAQDNDVVFRTTNSNQRLVFAISNQPIMTISNQNVGINTMTPRSRFHVEGDIYVNGTITTQMPVAFNGISLARTTAAAPTALTVVPPLESFFRDASSNLYISSGSNGYISFCSGTSNEIARLSSNGSFCIGTTTPQSRLTLQGTNSSSNGPHITTVGTSDQYPLCQLLSWTHNSIHLTLDGYFDGTNWLASHSTCFQISKSNNLMNFNYSAGNTAGNTAIFTPALTINSNGYVGINTTTPTTQLEVNGDIKVNKIVSSQFRAVQVFDSRQGALNGVASAAFTLGGGTLFIKGSFSLFNSTTVPSTSTCGITLTRQGTPATTHTFSTSGVLNLTNDHRNIPICRTLTGVASGSYIATVAISGTSGTNTDTTDYINLVIIEYPF